MTWTRLSDNYDDQTDALSDGAFRLLTNARVWCNRNLTDGLVPDARIARLVPAFRPAMLRELEATGWAVRVDDGWSFDWSDQEPAERVIRRRAKGLERWHRYQERLHTANAVSDGVTNSDPSRPVPSRYTQGGDERSAEGMNGRSSPVATDLGFRARMADAGVRR